MEAVHVRDVGRLETGFLEEIYSTFITVRKPDASLQRHTFLHKPVVPLNHIALHPIYHLHITFQTFSI